MAKLLNLRWEQYLDRLETEIRNSNLDPIPTGVNEYNEAGQLVGGDGELLKSEHAAAARSLFPAMKEEMKEIAANGSMEPDGVMDRVKGFFDGFVKGTLFPAALHTMRSEDNIVTGMVSTGHWIIATQELFYMFDLYNRGAQDASTWKHLKQLRDGQAGDNGEGSTTSEEATLRANTDIPLVPESLEIMMLDVVSPKVFGTVEGQMMVNMLKDMVSLMQAMLIVGLFMAFYIPAVVLIQWVIGVVTWMIYLAEAIIVIPLWGLLFVSDMGSQSLSPQSARQGLVHLLSILFYPALMVIGFVVGIKIIDIVSMWFLDVMEIGFNQFTQGYAFGLVSLTAGLAIIGFASYQVITRVFSLVLEFNQRMMNWIGQYNNYGEHNVEGQVRQGFVAFAYQGKSAAGAAGQADQQKRAAGNQSGGGSGGKE
jgi:conjugal transfer/type IV secretion protein DotA/TraY